MFVHTVAVYRQAATVSAGNQTFGAYAAVGGLGAVPCLVEPMQARQIATILGDLIEKAYWITWGAEDIRNGDRIVWNARTFALTYFQDDQHRVGTNIPAHQVGILREELFAPV